MMIIKFTLAFLIQIHVTITNTNISNTLSVYNTSTNTVSSELLVPKRGGLFVCSYVYFTLENIS